MLFQQIMGRNYFGTDLIKILGLHITSAFSYSMSLLGIYIKMKKRSNLRLLQS